MLTDEFYAILDEIKELAILEEALLNHLEDPQSPKKNLARIKKQKKVIAIYQEILHDYAEFIRPKGDL